MQNVDKEQGLGIENVRIHTHCVKENSVLEMQREQGSVPRESADLVSES